VYFNTIPVKTTQTQRINTMDEVPHTKAEDGHSDTDLAQFTQLTTITATKSNGSPMQHNKSFTLYKPT
jgi:hypothetical protein